MFIQLPSLISCSHATFALSGAWPTRIIFTVIMFFRLLQQPVSQMPNAISALIQMLVGLKRIGEFLKTEEKRDTGSDVRT